SIHPHVDRPKLFLYFLRGEFDRLRVGDVRWQSERLGPEFLDIPASSLQTSTATSDQPNTDAAAFSTAPNDSTTDASGSTSHDNDARVSSNCSLHRRDDLMHCG